MSKNAADSSSKYLFDSGLMTKVVLFIRAVAIKGLAGSSRYNGLTVASSAGMNRCSQPSTCYWH